MDGYIEAGNGIVNATGGDQVVLGAAQRTLGVKFIS